MPRALSGPILAALAAQMTQPGYLVEIGWVGSVVRLSSRGDKNWNSLVWVGVGAAVSGLSWDGTGEMRGSIQVLNGGTNTVSGDFTALAVALGVADIPIKVWIFDGAALAVGDPFLVVDGFGDNCTIDPAKVVFNFTSKRARTQFSPRRYICAEQGFSIIPPEGKRLDWGGQIYVLNRGR